MVAAIRTRGPWYDEFFTLYVASPRFGWTEALRHHWLTDNHPPLFYALARATAWLGDTVPPRRLVNLLLTLPAAAMLTFIGWRHAAWRTPLALFAIALVSSPVFVFYGAELRSNYLAYVSSAIAVASLAVLAGPVAPPLSRRNAALLVAVLAIAFTTHLAATVLTGGVAVTFVAALVLRRDWRGAIALCAVCAMAALPLVASLALQLGRIEANTRVFWIPAGFTAARWAVQEQAEMDLAANAAISLAGIVGLGLMGWSRRTRDADPRLTTALILIAGLAFGTAVLMALHMWRPIVINRYLVAMGPPAFLALAIGVQAVLERLKPASLRTALMALVIVSALWSMRSTMHRAAAEPSFTGTGQAIAALVHACPDTAVHADMHWNAPVMAMPPADNRAVMPMAYAMTAGALGFTLEPQNSRRMALQCPTVFWTDHVADVAITPELLTRSLRARGFAVRAVDLQRIGRGWIAISQP